MDRLWKHLMQLDAKALFFGAVALFLVVAAIVAWLYFHHTTATSTDHATASVATPATNESFRSIGVLGMVSNQVAAEALVVPVNPFRPGIENMLTQSNVAVQVARGRPSRNNNTRTSVNSSPGTPAKPQLTYCGYWAKEGETPKARFFDSVDGVFRFLAPGARIHEVALIACDIRSAKIQKADGSMVTLNINESCIVP